MLIRAEFYFSSMNLSDVNSVAIVSMREYPQPCPTDQNKSRLKNPDQADGQKDPWKQWRKRFSKKIRQSFLCHGEIFKGIEEISDCHCHTQERKPQINPKYKTSLPSDMTLPEGIPEIE